MIEPMICFISGEFGRPDFFFLQKASCPFDRRKKALLRLNNIQKRCVCVFFFFFGRNVSVKTTCDRPAVTSGAAPHGSLTATDIISQRHHKTSEDREC